MARTFELADGVYGIDLEMWDTEVLAAYLLVDDEPTLIETGTAVAVDRLLEGASDAGVAPPELANAVVSHVHVDHSGGAAGLAEHNPDLDVYIHESSADHLVEPGRLVESSKRVMGDHFDTMGAPDPLPEANLVRVPDDGTILDTGTRTLEVVHVPGHSPDHLAAFDRASRTLFATESIGSHFPKTDMWLPPATLPNFDVEAVASSIETLRSLDPDRIAFSHFGPWPASPESAFDTAVAELDAFDERILELHERHGDVEAVVDRVRAELLEFDAGYDRSVGSFYAPLVTRGFLNYHGLP